jgi:hypothetical protein
MAMAMLPHPRAPAGAGEQPAEGRPSSAERGLHGVCTSCSGAGVAALRALSRETMENELLQVREYPWTIASACGKG